MRILVVDDEPAILSYLPKLLESWGHSALPLRGCTAEDAAQILQEARTFPFDIAIIDGTMPGMNGMELIELLSPASPATVLILSDTGPCIECSAELGKRGLWVQPLLRPFEGQELQEILENAVSSRHAHGLVHRISLPKEPVCLEEANLPPKLVERLAGTMVEVDVLRAEQPRTRKVEPDDVPLWIDPQGNYWNDYRPLRVFYTDDEGRVWRFRKTWLPGLRPHPENHANAEILPTSRNAVHETLSMPTEWDIWEINIPWEIARANSLRRVEVEVRASGNEWPKVLWRDRNGSVWRIPSDWRKRRIRLPESDILAGQGVSPTVARQYGERTVTVNYHPGSLCCLPDRYRFRDGRGNRWPVRIADCSVLGYGSPPLR